MEDKNWFSDEEFLFLLKDDLFNNNDNYLNTNCYDSTTYRFSLWRETNLMLNLIILKILNKYNWDSKDSPDQYFGIQIDKSKENLTTKYLGVIER